MSKPAFIAIVGSVTLALSVAPVLAQTNTSQPVNSNLGTQSNTRTGSSGQNYVKEFNAQLVRTDKVLGATVYDGSGKEIGEIRDVVFDENKGGMTRAILSISDYLGIGSDQLTPIEWNKMSITNQPDGSMKFTLTADKAQLRNEHSFSDDKWPDFTNGWKGENIDHQKLVRMSKAKDAELFDQNGHQIGDIEDLMLDTQNGKIAYAVVSFSSDYIDKGDQLTMIPWPLIRQSKPATPGYVLSANKTELQGATYFDSDAWPTFNTLAWNKAVYDHYNATPYFWTGS
jgi:sporulation protein YlmC with PRC-barrel domain